MNSAFSMTSWQGGRMKDTHITQSQFAMIWFGAALSIAEIMTGTYLAPLGLTQGLYAIYWGISSAVYYSLERVSLVVVYGKAA